MKHNKHQAAFLEKQLRVAKEQRALNQQVYRDRTLTVALKKALGKVNVAPHKDR